jgi:tetratricopeptide (TPR) repeat protein
VLLSLFAVSKEGIVSNSSSGRKLSVAVIARDAESTIAAALESVRSIADEIVVIDTGSSDRTREIARRGASRVIDFNWSDDFSAARNFALTQITGDWILWLDASEELERESATALRRALDGPTELKTAYSLLIRLPAGLGQLEGEQAARVRLWPVQAGLKFTGRIREQITPALEAAGMKVASTAWCIRRSKRELDQNLKSAKAHRNVRLAEMEMKVRGKQPELLLTIAEAHATLGEFEQAIAAFYRVIEASPSESDLQLEAYYGLLTAFDSRPGSQGEQIAACLKALEVFPFDSQLLCAMGSYLQAQGRLELACRSYQMAVEHGTINTRVWHLPNLAELAVICFSLTLELQGRMDEARVALETALQSQGNADRLRRRLIDLYVKQNKRQEALAEIDRLPAAAEPGGVPHRDALRNAVRGACLAGQQQWPSALAYLRTAYEAGCRDAICLRWLALGLLANGETAAAQSTLLQWQYAAPENPEPQRLLNSIAAQTTVANSGDGAALRVDSSARNPSAGGGAPHLRASNASQRSNSCG